MLDTLREQGFYIEHGLLGATELSHWQAAIAPLLQDSPAGIRGLAEKLPGLRELAESSKVRALLRPVMGPAPRLVRALLFNKTRTGNWQVGWHQDLSIAVQERIETPGYGGWSLKDGVPHVQAPLAILENMLTLRLHLDSAGADNGALWVAPGSHRMGRISSAGAEAAAQQYGPVLCEVEAGDVLLMRPLLLHSSQKATSARPRRIIHLEFAGVELPAPLLWHSA